MLALVLFLAVSALASASARERYSPPVMPPPVETPRVWFGREARTGRWCAMDAATLSARSSREELSADESAWLSDAPGGAVRLSVESQSEDAAVVDRYEFDARGKTVRMVRTGRYIESPTASFDYARDRRGRLRLTARARDVVRRMQRAGYETYIVDWPRYDGVEALPFAGRIVAGPPIGARPGCG